LLVVADASVLINFLVVGRMDLIARYARRVLVTDHVAAEIASAYPEQQRRYENALAAEAVEELRVDSKPELALFGRLTAPGRLGAGECSAIAVAVSRRHALAIDDRRAIREAKALDPTLEVLGTQAVMVEMIRQGLIAVPDADALLAEWAGKHRFRLKIASFADLM
jgi:predicted nucleic acid-binding protein